MSKSPQQPRLADQDKALYRQILGLPAEADLPAKLVDAHVSVMHAMSKLQLQAVGLNDQQKIIIAAISGCLPLPAAPVAPTAPLSAHDSTIKPEAKKEPALAGK